MTVGDLKKAIGDLPDDMELIGEWRDGGQKEIMYSEVCTHEHGGLHHSEESLQDTEAFDPEGWSKLDKPTLKLVVF